MLILQILYESIFAIEVTNRVSRVFPEINTKIIIIKTDGKFKKDFEKLNVVYLEDASSFQNILLLFKDMMRADRIVLYALSGNQILNMLTSPFLGHKMYWICWGGELYDYKLGYLGNSCRARRNELLKIMTIKNIGYFCGWHRNEYDDAKRLYPFLKGTYIDIFMPYKINEAQPNDTLLQDNIKQKSLKIMIGHSGSKINHHIDAMKKIAFLRNKEVEIICPMTYALDKEYMNKVKKFGFKIFGNKFSIYNPKWLDDEKYQKFLSEVDIAIFNNGREQALGNIQILLFFGKKIFVNKKNCALDIFMDLNAYIFEFKKFSNEEQKKFLNPLSNVEKNINRDIAQFYSSDKHYSEVWSQILTKNVNSPSEE